VRSIPGLEYVELQHPDRCCGSAGIYNILQPDIATQLLDEKLADIAATAAQVVVVTNPGCQLQISAGIQRAGLDVRVVHLVQLLDEAYTTERGEFYVNPFAVPGALGPL
jgi:glycolate oxidase iron-sulfur subunit